MANLSINEAIALLDSLPQRIADEVIKIMKSEAPSKTGTLKASIDSDISDTNIFVGITDKEVLEYAPIVISGRKEVRPKGKARGGAKVLRWFDGGPVFSMKSKAVAPNDFIERTKNRVQAMSFTLTGG